MPSLGRLDPAQLSGALRHSRAPGMRERRWIAGLAMFSGMVMSGIGLFQMGMIRRIPEPRWRWFDSRRINGSAQAYSILHTPDALLGAMSYAATACLASASDPDRAQTAPWIPLAMGAKLAGDAALAAKMTADQWRRYRAFCFWCLLNAGATFAAAALGARETAAALRTISGRGLSVGATD
jgi:uncharacterized membrane protein